MLLAQLVAFIVGLFTYFIAFFMYEDEAGIWQNRLEVLWVAISDREKSLGSKTAALFDVVANHTAKVFDDYFGLNLISFRLIGVSTAYSIGGSFLLVSFAAFDHHDSVGPYLFLFGFCALLCAGEPYIRQSRIGVAISCAPVCFLLFSFLILVPANPQFSLRAVAIMFSCAIIGITTDILVIVLTRFTIRRFVDRPTMAGIVVMLLAQAGVIYVLIVLPFKLVERTPNSLTPYLILGLFSVNIITSLFSSIFFLAVLFVLLHRLFWPIAGRLVYALARYELVRNQKVMAAIGTGCFLFAIPMLKAILSVFK